MYYGQRDKVISVRVSSKLLGEAQAIIDSYTRVYCGRGGRNHYECAVPGFNRSWEKVSIADLFEKALNEFVENVPMNPNAK